MKVLEEEGVVTYLKKRNLQKAYLKAKRYLESNRYKQIDLRKRHPKHLGVFYFKIDKKYRTLGYIENNTFIVTEISDHQ